jgi:ABC-type Fe3+-hydroxamate transport system substrate-binding protein
VTIRVVSLVPSVTETQLAWGVTPVAVTRFCEQPSLPQVGGTKDPDLDAIAALRPDLVVVDTEENRREDADALAAAGLDVHATSVRSVADVATQLAALAARVGVSPDAGLMGTVKEAARNEGAARRRAFIPIWRHPWMTIGAGTYGSSLLSVIGVDNVFADADSAYPEVTLDDVAALAPDLVVAPSEPYPFGPRHVHELSSVAPVTLVDGQDLFWWGVRTPAAITRLRQALL